MNSETSTAPGSVDNIRNKLGRDIRTVVGDGDALLKGIASSASGELSDALTSVAARIDDARNAVGERARGAADATHTYVATHPWRVIGVVAGLGLLLGAIFGRR